MNYYVSLTLFLSLSWSLSPRSSLVDSVFASNTNTTSDSSGDTANSPEICTCNNDTVSGCDIPASWSWSPTDSIISQELYGIMPSISSLSIQPMGNSSIAGENLTVINQLTTKHFYFMYITWDIPVAKLLSQGVEGIQVSVFGSSLTDRLPLRAESPCSCKGYNITKENTSSLSVISHATCFDGIIASTDYQVSLTCLPQNQTLAYYLSVPDDMNRVLEPESASRWQSIVAFAVEVTQGHARCHVAFQQAPEWLQIPQYLATVTDTGRHFVLNNTLVNDSSLSLNVSGKAVDFYAKLFALGDECITLNCSVTRSISVRLRTIHVLTTTSSPVASVTEAAAWSSTCTPMETSATQDTSVVVEPSDSDDHQRKLTIALGTVGGLVGAALVILLACCIYRRKTGRRSLCFDSYGRRRLGEDGSGGEDLLGDGQDMAMGDCPSVLILYSCDSDAHEQVVVELATYLKHVCRCSVVMDLWEQNDVNARGAFYWLQQKLDACQYVLVVCSTGARLRCSSRGRQSAPQPRDARPVPDILPQAVDMVAERVWALRKEGRPLDKFLVACFDHTGENDVPPKLDQMKRFSLMGDIEALYEHLHPADAGDSTTRPWGANLPPLFRSSSRKDVYGRTCATYHLTDTGGQLSSALQKAQLFLENNPNWYSDLMGVSAPDAVTAAGSGSRTTCGSQSDGKKDSLLQSPSLPRNGPPDVTKSTPPPEDGSGFPRGFHNGDQGDDDTSPVNELSDVTCNPTSGPLHPTDTPQKVNKLPQQQNGGVSPPGPSDTRGTALVPGKHLSNGISVLQNCKHKTHINGGVKKPLTECDLESRLSTGRLDSIFVPPPNGSPCTKVPAESTGGSLQGVAAEEKKSLPVDEEANDENDAQQMLKDIDFIQNFDLYYSWNSPGPLPNTLNGFLPTRVDVESHLGGSDHAAHLTFSNPLFGSHVAVNRETSQAIQPSAAQRVHASGSVNVGFYNAGASNA